MHLHSASDPQSPTKTPTACEGIFRWNSIGDNVILSLSKLVISTFFRDVPVVLLSSYLGSFSLPNRFRYQEDAAPSHSENESENERRRPPKPPRNSVGRDVAGSTFLSISAFIIEVPIKSSDANVTAKNGFAVQIIKLNSYIA